MESSYSLKARYTPTMRVNVVAKRKKISFLARVRVKRKVSFKARGKDIAFTARVPSKKRARVTFFTKKRKKQRG